MKIIINLVIIFTIIIVPTSGSIAPEFWNATYSAGNFTEDSPYNASLFSAFSDLVSMAASKTFANVTVGLSESSRVYALFSCQHDLPLHVCQSCVENATSDILGLFYPNPKEAIIIYEECMLRYANRMIFSTMELEPYDNDCNIIKYYSHTTEIKTAVKQGFETLIDQATNSTDYFAVGGVKNVVMDYDLYFLVQCTPDITKEECNTCLLHALNSTVASCGSDGRLSGHTMGPSCIMRYDYNPFFYSEVISLADMGPPTTTSPPLKYDKHDRSKDTLGLIFSIFIIIVLVILIFAIKNRVCCR
ncbi:hypothetical protein RND81_10G169300 [Saponaria officinalis]|uniref:Gnk2-homologous domain-containing protein n=1 Tax=Saponaria officinalis TaxID=3572 RepID=A0AAW1I5S8_SAPOF